LYELIGADGTPKDAATLLADIRGGAVDAAALAAACHREIENRDGAIGAWIALDWAAVAEQVHALQARPAWRELPLAGLPVGVKDIFDTRDFPTAYGSDIYAGHRPAADAAAVARLREAGAIVVGKTVSTEFAYWKAGKTRNPLDPARSPGGSSSGSAAAVAAGMVPLAIGSQTAASTIRPAAYCGIVGFKPSLGLISLAGVKSLANSLDTVGVFARDVTGAALIASVLTGRPGLARPIGPVAPPSFHLARAVEWAAVQPDTLARTLIAADRLRDAGATVTDGDCAPPFTELAAVQTAIMALEAARELAAERLDHDERLSPQLRELFATGMSITAADYDAACGMRDVALADLEPLFAGAEFLLAPSAPAEAPLFEDGTGSPDMSRSWTLLGLPSITVPIGTGAAGLALGLQIAGRPREERRLLEAADWAAKAIDGARDT